MNRRELLKFFSVGTIIAPTVATNIQARLIETPKIEIITPKILEPQVMDLWEAETATLTLTAADGRTRVIRTQRSNDASARFGRLQVYVERPDSYSPSSVVRFEEI